MKNLILFALVILICTFSYADVPERSLIVARTQGRALSIVDKAINNILAKEQDSRFRRQNKDILEMYLVLQKTMKSGKKKIEYYTGNELYMDELTGEVLSSDLPTCLKNHNLNVIAQTEVNTWGPFDLNRPIIKLCNIFFNFSDELQAYALIHEYLHTIGLNDECATDTQANLILHFAGLAPIKSGYYDLCKFKDFFDDLENSQK